MTMPDVFRIADVLVAHAVEAHGGKIWIVGGYREASFPDLSEPAAQGDLEALARRVQQLDEMMVEWLTGHSIALNILESEAELRRFLEQRDPKQD